MQGFCTTHVESAPLPAPRRPRDGRLGAGPDGEALCWAPRGPLPGPFPGGGSPGPS